MLLSCLKTINSNIQTCLFILWSSFLPGFSRVSPSILLKMVFFLEKWKKAPGVLNISARKKSRINGILGKSRINGILVLWDDYFYFLFIFWVITSLLEYNCFTMVC